MRAIDIPFEIVDQKMYMQQVTWPQRCACCGKDHEGASYNLVGRLRISPADTSVARPETGFAVSFAVPYCSVCNKHARPVMNSYVVIGLLGFALWVLVGWLMFAGGLGETIGALLFLVAGALIGGGCYLISKPVINKLSKSRMTDTCSSSGFAVTVSPVAGNWRVWFDNDEYARDFGSQNALQVLVPAEPQ